MRLNSYPIRGTFKPNTYLSYGQFAPNGTSQPLITSLRGSLSKAITSIVRNSAGNFTITMISGYSVPATYQISGVTYTNYPIITCSASCNDLTATNLFSVVQIGIYNTASSSFVLQTYNSSGAFDAPANANNLVNFTIEAVDTTGR